MVPRALQGIGAWQRSVAATRRTMAPSVTFTVGCELSKRRPRQNRENYSTTITLKQGEQNQRDTTIKAKKFFLFQWKCSVYINRMIAWTMSFRMWKTTLHHCGTGTGADHSSRSSGTPLNNMLRTDSGCISSSL